MATYIANNAAAIADYSERWDHGESISTAFVESTVNLVISRRFAKKQQMQWSKKGAHRLLQTRTQTLDGTLRDLFTSWYPAMAANDGPTRLIRCRSLSCPTVSGALPTHRQLDDALIESRGRRALDHMAEKVF